MFNISIITNIFMMEFECVNYDAELAKEGLPAMTKMASIIQRYAIPKSMVRENHTDVVGKASPNIQISKNYVEMCRAKQV